MVYEDLILNNPSFPTVDSSENPYFVAMFYDKEENVFVDEDGLIVWRIFDYITPNDLLLFRENREYMCVRHHSQKGVFVELYWPNEDEWDGNPDTVCEYCNDDNYPLCDQLED